MEASLFNPKKPILLRFYPLYLLIEIFFKNYNAKVATFVPKCKIFFEKISFDKNHYIIINSMYSQIHFFPWTIIVDKFLNDCNFRLQKS